MTQPDQNPDRPHQPPAGGSPGHSGHAGHSGHSPEAAPPVWEAQRPPAPQPTTQLPQFGPGSPPAGGYPGAPYGDPGYQPAYGYPQPGSGAAPKPPRGPAPYALIAAGLGLLALVLSFFPWISPRIEFGSLSEFVSDDDRDLITSTLDDLYANAWDLRWATRSVLLAVVAALLLLAPVIDRRLRSPWMQAAAVAASAGATVLMIVQIVNRSGIYGRVLDVLSDLANADPEFADTGDASVGLALRWGAFATAAVVFAQFAVLMVLWLSSRPADDTTGGDPGSRSAPGA